jgi:phage-related protein
MDVLTFETCWAVSNEIINKWHQVGLSLFNYLKPNKSTIIKHLKPNVNSVFNGISLIIKTFFTIIKGIYK